jgi:hypothetical protein
MQHVLDPSDNQEWIRLHLATIAKQVGWENTKTSFGFDKKIR